MTYQEVFPSRKPTNFADDLKFSHDQVNAPFWEEVYRGAFPDFSSMVDVRKDGWAQRGGVDRIIITSAGMIWRVDEKARRQYYEVEKRLRAKYFPEGAKLFPDILLEMLSDEAARTPGWVQKDLACHYINYAILPIRCAFLLPVAPLQRAWRKNKDRWIEEFGTRRAENKYNGRSWKTLNCPVPVPEVMRRLSEAMYFHFKSNPIIEAPLEQVNASDIPF